MIFQNKITWLLVLTSVVSAVPVKENSNDENDNSVNPRGMTFFQARSYQGNIIIKENVEVDTLRNYVVVHAPPMGDYKEAIIFYDYNLNLTMFVYPASKHCYLMDRYTDIPDDMSYWFTFRESTQYVKAFDGNRMGRYKHHEYQITERNVDRSSLVTDKMRQYCTEKMEIRRGTMVTEDEMVPGSDEPEGDFEDKHVIMMPYVPEPGERVKRGALAMMAPHCCTAHLAR